jgi:hypothetical protein
MLDHLKQRVARILASTEKATLSTSGPAGIQARIFPCEAVEVCLYLLVPGTSDHLLNLEQNPFAVVSTPGWQLRGTARALPQQGVPADLQLPRSPAGTGCVLVEIRASQLQIYRRNGWGFSETIDIDSTPQT